MRILALCLGLCFCVAAQGQYKNSKGDKTYIKFKGKSKYHAGVITMLNSTEVEGVMKRTTSYLADGDLKLVTRSGEKKSLFAREILCYQANGEKHLSFSGELYKEEIDGKGISLYSQIGTNTYTTGGGPNAPMMTHTSSFTMFFVKKENETNPTLVPSEKRKFKAFASYFSECEQVQKSIASGELKSKEVRSVVLRYNNCILRASSDEE